MIHDLKVWPQYFAAIVSGDKQFELRKDDRGFQLNDFLRLREWCPSAGDYTGNSEFAQVTYLLKDETWLQPGVVCMGIDLVDEEDVLKAEVMN